MGKGSNTTTTNQSQTYTPTGGGYIQNALNQAQNAAQLPFNIPQAPVAGFSADQQQAFQNVNNAQGMAQPYFNQAQNYFQQSAQGPNISQFFNPYASAVTAQLNNIFGQQASQNTGQLTQAAGGVGADRIAVGQSQLANQQGLAAGQTLSGLYAPSLQAAQNQQNILQSAGYGTAALGSQAQNAALQGAQAQLGTGGLQQQLSQAQLNAPYQQQLAQAAFPYQQSQFLTGAVGALAPGLGGTTTGQGTTTGPTPSLLSQILGGGTAAAGILGGTGAFGSNGWLSGGGSKGSNPSAAGTPGSPYYGPVNSGGYAGGGGVSDEPIDVAPQSTIPQVQTPQIQAHIPQLNLNPPQQQQSQSGGNAAAGIGSVVKLASMFMKRGGAANPYGFADGGDTDVINPDEPFRLTPQEDLQNWRNSVDRDMVSGEASSPTMQALSYAPSGGGATGAPSGGRLITGATQPSPLDTAQWPHGPVGAPSNPYSAPGAAPPSTTADAQAQAPAQDIGQSFIKSPWAALTAAGLGIMGGTSPFAGVNIGQGAMQGLKALETQRTEAQKDETIKQAQERLKQQADYQKWEMSKPVPMGQTIGPLGLPMTTYAVSDGKGGWTPIQANASQEGSTNNPVKDIAQGIESGHRAPNLTGMGRLSPLIAAQLERDGFNVTQAQLEYDAAHKQILSLNGPQMVRFVGLAGSVDRTIDEVNQLGEQMKNSGIPLLNQAKIAELIHLEGNSERGQLAARYIGAVNTLKEEFANLANGGYAPTEPAWKLANEQINGNYGVKELGASLGEVQRLIRYRMQGIPNMSTLGPGAANRYVPGVQGGQAGGAGAASAAPAGAAQPAAPAAAAPQFKEGATATNKQTGQKMIYRNGQWVPQ